MKKYKPAILLIIMLLLINTCMINGCSGNIPFEEKNKVEVTMQNESLQFTNLGKGDGGVLVSFTLGGSMEPNFRGFQEGTLVIVGKGGVVFPEKRSEDRDGYSVYMSSFELTEGTEVQIRQEGGIYLNLDYVQKGQITESFTIIDNKYQPIRTKEGVVIFYSRAIVFKNGKVESITLNSSEYGSEIKLTDGKYIDLKSLHFDIKK